MARRVAKGMTVEEFDAWSAARDRTAAVAESADENGGPRLSLVPVPDQHDAWPTDLLAPAPAASPEAAPDTPASDANAPDRPPETKTCSSLRTLGTLARSRSPSDPEQRVAWGDSDARAT